MPWCEDCAKYMAPSALNPDGTCPTCGRQVAEAEEPREKSDEKAPWHFKLMIVALVVYLGYRFTEMFL
jgi:hypothetical protein